MQFILTNWYLFVALGVVLALLLSGPITQRLYGIRTLSLAEAVRIMNHENGVVVDVCEPAEFRTGHIPKAVNAPLSGIAGQMRELDRYKGRPIIVSCRSGNRSQRGAVILRKHGFERVYSLDGGLSAWQRDNLPVTRG